MAAVLAVTGCLLAPVLAVPAAGAQAPSGGGVAAHDVSARDRLIADQENLLNAYRCMFSVDTHAVPGGCGDPDMVAAGAVPQNPTQSDLDVRDGLIQSQEVLLNVYRCRYDIDTQLVPSGCTGDTTPADPALNTPDPLANIVFGEDFFGVFSFVCAIGSDQLLECSGDGGRMDTPGVPLTKALESGGSWDFVERELKDPIVLCGLTADQSLACWGWESAWDDADNLLVSPVELGAPAGAFTEIAIYYESIATSVTFILETTWCGRRADQSLACWTWDEERDDDGMRVRTPADLPVPD